MQREVIAVAARVFERRYALNLLGKRPRMLDRDKRIVAIHVHSQIGAGVGDLRADVAQTDNSNALALQLAADERLLRLFRIHENVGVGSVFAHPIHRLHNATARKHEHRQNELFHGIGVRARRIEYHDALLGIFLDGNIVHAGAATRDGANAFRQLIAVQVGRAHENRIGLFGFGHELVAVAKGNLAVFRDVVDGFDIAHGNLLLDYRTVCRIQRKPSILEDRSDPSIPRQIQGSYCNDDYVVEHNHPLSARPAKRRRACAKRRTRVCESSLATPRLRRK